MKRCFIFGTGLFFVALKLFSCHSPEICTLIKFHSDDEIKEAERERNEIKEAKRPQGNFSQKERYEIKETSSDSSSQKDRNKIEEKLFWNNYIALLLWTNYFLSWLFFIHADISHSCLNTIYFQVFFCGEIFYVFFIETGGCPEYVVSPL